MPWLWLGSLCIAAFSAGAETPARGSAAPRWFQGTFLASTGVDYSSGRYGATSTTDIIYVPLSLGYRFERLTLTETPRDELELRLTVPFLDVDGPASTGVVADPAQDGGQGLGDVVVRATYRYFPRQLPLFEVTGKVKVPTADEQDGLGTGEADYSLELGLAKRMGVVSVFGNAGFRIRGDANFVSDRGGRPARLSLDDGFFTSIGSSGRLTDRMGIGLSYDWREAASSIGDTHELVPFLWFDWTKRWRLTPYAVVGLARGSPEFALGLSLRFAQAVR